MNVFQSNSAPFLLALIVSGLGWYVGQINEDLRNTKVATYRLDADADAPHARVMIQNVSRTQSLDKISFALVCPIAATPDKTRLNQGDYIAPPPIHPIDPVLGRDESGQMSVSASLAPGGSIGLEATLADCAKSPLQFFYRPSGTDRFLLLEQNSIDGWMASKYRYLLLILFVVLSFLFLVWIAVSITFWWRSRNESAMAGNLYRVRLYFGDSSDLGTAPHQRDENQPDGEGRKRRR